MQFLHAPWYLFPEGLRPLRVFPFKEIFPSLRVCSFGAGEDDCVAFPSLLSSWRKPASVSFCALSFCFPLIAFFLLPFSADRFPFTSFHRYSCFNYFVAGLKVSVSEQPIRLFTVVFNLQECHGFLS